MRNSSSENKITILGIGNSIFSDEGVGVHILPLLEELYKDDQSIEIIEGSTDGMKLLGPVEDTDYLLVIDAINAGKSGGEIIVLKGEEIPAYFGIKMSIHQLGFQEVLFAAKLRERYPKNITMVGMQPSCLDLGVQLSPVNQAKLTDLAKAVQHQIQVWREAM
ncbi:HyaD/HybD family hydrogenase maturation endopeptidase [Bacillus marasmi]|uniref:HyaD/HybD family hydrogenase maturation endopeptidase n=1 Tax=Bacillus marasmi TaxID=1926279 RepID=UPI0011C73343|nr:HyaD/HybD family hydrogenase maturation endopeptidase [Bacillus marasmi]